MSSADAKSVGREVVKGSSLGAKGMPTVERPARPTDWREGIVVAVVKMTRGEEGRGGEEPSRKGVVVEVLTSKGGRDC